MATTFSTRQKDLANIFAWSNGKVFIASAERFVVILRQFIFMFALKKWCQVRIDIVDFEGTNLSNLTFNNYFAFSQSIFAHHKEFPLWTWSPRMKCVAFGILWPKNHSVATFGWCSAKTFPLLWSETSQNREIKSF